MFLIKILKILEEEFGKLLFEFKKKLIYLIFYFKMFLIVLYIDKSK